MTHRLTLSLGLTAALLSFGVGCASDDGDPDEVVMNNPHLDLDGYTIRDFNDLQNHPDFDNPFIGVLNQDDAILMDGPPIDLEFADEIIDFVGAGNDLIQVSTVAREGQNFEAYQAPLTERFVYTVDQNNYTLELAQVRVFKDETYMHAQFIFIPSKGRVGPVDLTILANYDEEWLVLRGVFETEVIP